jgi:hypothetical protein
MKKPLSVLRLLLILPLSLAIASYATDIAEELLEDYYFGAPHVLIDSSRDGGAWWSPQPFIPGVFDPGLDHQGKALADYLRSLGMDVTELPRPFAISPELLEGFDVVVRVNAYPKSAYTPEEIAAYRQYVGEGGPLILLADFADADDPDTLALAFGLDLRGSLTGFVDQFSEHPITSGLQALRYPAGSVLVDEPPARTTELGFIGDETAMGLTYYGYGQIFFMGDIAAVTFAEQPLTQNLVVWFLTAEGLAAQVLQAGLEPEAEKALLNFLDAALRSLDRGHMRSYVNQLDAFINKVEALERSGRIDPAAAESLIGSTLTLIYSVTPG